MYEWFTITKLRHLKLFFMPSSLYYKTQMQLPTYIIKLVV